MMGSKLSERCGEAKIKQHGWETVGNKTETMMENLFCAGQSYSR